MNSRIKVSTEKLIAAVKTRREELVTQYEEMNAVYADHEKILPTLCTKALQKVLAEVKAGDIPELHTNYRSKCHIEVTVDIGEVEKPSENAQVNNLANIDRLIKTLEMSSETTQTISADDAAQYLG